MNLKPYSNLILDDGRGEYVESRHTREMRYAQSLACKFGVPHDEARDEAHFLAHRPVDEHELPVDVVRAYDYCPDSDRDLTKTFTDYYLTEQIGQGVYGHVFVATLDVPGNSDDDDDHSMSGDLRAQSLFVVKRVCIGDLPAVHVRRYHPDAKSIPQRVLPNNNSYFLDCVDKEVLLGQIIRRRLGDSLYAKFYSCPFRRVYSMDKSYAYSISTLRSTVNLGTFLHKVLHPKMAEVETKIREFCTEWCAANNVMHSIDNVADFISLAHDFTNRSDVRKAYALTREAVSLVNVCSILSLQLMQAVQLLNSKGVFHSDIKPSNIVVRTGSDLSKFQLMLIDFGLACAVPDEDDSIQNKYESEIVESGDRYATTLSVCDPLALYLRVDFDLTSNSDRYLRNTQHGARVYIPESQMAETFAHFESYSVAKNIMVIYGEQTPLVDGAVPACVSMDQQPFFMRKGRWEVLQHMTSSDTVIRCIDDDNVATPEQLDCMMQMLEHRVSLSTAMSRMTTISTHF